MSKKKGEVKNNWSQYGLRILFNTAAHPIEYAKVLIQIGHEPFPPRLTTTFFGKPALKLPNVFEYVKYIKSVDGFVGCYRGFVPKVCSNLVCAFANEKVLDILDEMEAKENKSNIVRGPKSGKSSKVKTNLDNAAADGNAESSLNQPKDGAKDDEEASDFEEDESEEEIKKKFMVQLKRDLISRVTAIVVSQPFHVITIRMMAQFVGKETKYNGMFSSVVEIYKQNGILGFFSGLVPRVIGDVAFILLASSLTYTVNSYIKGDQELSGYVSATMSFIASALIYPFQVVANCMVVTDSGLAAGMPPRMPLYSSWIACWSDLSRHNQLKRGSSVLVRYYLGPQMIVRGQPVAITRGEVRSFS